MKKIIVATVDGYGIKKRCRKEAFQSFDLTECEPDKVDRATLVVEASLLWQREMKTTRKAWLELREWEEDDHHIRSTMIIGGTDTEKIPLLFT